MTGLIVIDGLSKRFGNLVAVDEAINSLDVPKGEVLGFLGPNGRRQVDHHENGLRLPRP